mgnify:CR=1 FL=1
MGFFGNNHALEKIDRDIAAIAEGSADLSHTVGTSGSDTAGRLSGNINRFFVRVRGLISRDIDRNRPANQRIAVVRRPHESSRTADR